MNLRAILDADEDDVCVRNIGGMIDKETLKHGFRKLSLSPVTNSTLTVLELNPCLCGASASAISKLSSSELMVGCSFSELASVDDITITNSTTFLPMHYLAS